MDLKGGFVLEVDLRKFFDTLDHGHLRTFLQQRVRDGVLLRLIGKWLNAGVMDEATSVTRTVAVRRAESFRLYWRMPTCTMFWTSGSTEMFCRACAPEPTWFGTRMTR